MTLPSDLDQSYELEAEQRRFFQKNGYVKLKNVLSPQTLEHYGQEITRQVIRLNDMLKPMSERTTYEKAFLQVMNIWTKSEVVKEFTFSRRLAKIAADLMGVGGVRLYHDQALYKEPGGGITPWHADQYYWPLSSTNTCTVWVPLQRTPLELGPLAFAVGSHRFESGRDLEISDESEAKLQEALDAQHFPLDETPFDLGEVSYHRGWTFHRAAANRSDRARGVMTVIYMEDGIRLTELTNKNHVQDRDWWMPGAEVGEAVNTRLNPVLYSG